MPLASLTLISGENQTARSKTRTSRRRRSRPELRVSRREEGPVNKAGYASFVILLTED